MAGARIFAPLQAELAKRGIELQIVEAQASVRDMLRDEGVKEKVGHIDRFRTIADALERRADGSAAARPARNALGAAGSACRNRISTLRILPAQRFGP